ncbi:hypothetical protein [Enterococcus camelliae]|uniref:Carbohydrate-binding protein n=1 Tax=Enterococcus camelliae TaxID=453959 RepID=A0ABW5TIN5_9ENTE
MITLCLKNDKDGEIISHSDSHEVYIALKERSYRVGDVIEIEVAKANQFLWIQIDESFTPSLVYFKKKKWRYPVLLDEQLRRAFTPKFFSGERHYIRAWKPTIEELAMYRNLACNPHDQKEDSGVYPHADANIETRNDSTFFARNAIDGMIANQSHGSFPYQSWGINQNPNAQWTVYFGRTVLIDKLAFVLRADYPHDSYWTQATVGFSDNTDMSIVLTNDKKRQIVSIAPQKTEFITLKNLIKHEDDSPFPALTEFEAYGYESK